MTDHPRPDPSRRDVLRTVGHGVLAAGLASPIVSMAAPTSPSPGNPAPDVPKGGSPSSGAGVKKAEVPPKKPVDWSTPLAPPDKQPPDLKVPQASGKKVGWAIVGLGKLALEEVLPAFRLCERSRPVALVSGHSDKAKQVAAAYGIDEKNLYTYESMGRLRDNNEVDVVYVITPNSLHAEHTVRGLRAGKHVLCEKPMAANVQECEQMVAAAKQAGRKLMIAYRLRYEPYNQSMIEMARTRAYGPIRLIEASNVQNIDPPNIRLSRELGGGALMDIGIYCLNACRYVAGEEPVEVSGWVHSDPSDPRFREVDESIVFTLRFPSGVMASCSASHGGAEGRRYRVYCADGWFELDPAFSYRGLRMRVGRKQGEDQQEVREVRLREVNHFASEMDHFSDCVLDDKRPWTPGEEGLQDLRIMMKIFEAAHTGKTVRI